MTKKIRIGLNPHGEGAPADDLTAPFDAGHASAVRTPQLNMVAPTTGESLCPQEDQDTALRRLGPYCVHDQNQCKLSRD